MRVRVWVRSPKNGGAYTSVCKTIFDVRTCVSRTGKYIATQFLNSDANEQFWILNLPIFSQFLFGFFFILWGKSFWQLIILDKKDADINAYFTKLNIVCSSLKSNQDKFVKKIGRIRIPDWWLTCDVSSILCLLYDVTIWRLFSWLNMTF